ncbi:hypothetical protein [Rhizobium sp. MHM7A]|uniref:hypothetical protein n=1 Tax=Rhizobium sp. MHM7A TaxID=2583233 RepID=UPI0011058706|nr:hypothetical protein [Rhizobium sp. MHM7A]TLX15888.1 hypothetical protein FFR93_00815 [Rhizobium sp. MHM7A]
MTPEQIYNLPSKSGEPWNEVAPAVIDGVFDLNYFSEIRDIETTDRLIVQTKMEYVFDRGEQATSVKVLEFDGSPFAIYIASGEYNAHGHAFVTDRDLFDAARKYVIDGLHPEKAVKVVSTERDFFSGYENAKVVQVDGVHKLVDVSFVSRKSDRLLFDEEKFNPYRLEDRTPKKLSQAVTAHLDVEEKCAVEHRCRDDLIVAVFIVDGETYFAQIEGIERVLVQRGHIEISIRSVGPASFYGSAVNFFKKGRVTLDDPAILELQEEFALSAEDARAALVIWLKGERDSILASIVEQQRSIKGLAEWRGHQREFYHVCKLIVERPERVRYCGDSDRDLEQAKHVVRSLADRFEEPAAGLKP